MCMMLAFYWRDNCIFTPSWFLPTGFALTFSVEVPLMPFNCLTKTLKIHNQFIWSQKNANKISKWGVIPGVEARCTGSITLEVVFGSPDNFRSEELIFDIVPFCSAYHALLGRTAFARFNAVPHYAYLKLKMPGPRGVITVNGNTRHRGSSDEIIVERVGANMAIQISLLVIDRRVVSVMSACLPNP